MSDLPGPRYKSWDLMPATDRFDLIKDRGITVERRAANWPMQVSEPLPNAHNEEWIAVRMWVSETMLRDAVQVTPRIRSGVPVLKGTRISIAQILGEVADGRSVAELADAFDVDIVTLRTLFEGLAIQFDRPFTR